MINGLRLCKSHCVSLFLNESHSVSVNGLLGALPALSFQFFTRLAAVFAEEVGGFGINFMPESFE